MLIIKIVNVSDLAPVSDYEYAVFVNDQQIDGGTVCNHVRDEGWKQLVKRIVEGER